MMRWDQILPRELDIALAQRIGWQDIRLESEAIPMPWDDYEIVKDYWGISPNGELSVVPYYSDDMNLAVSLLTSCGNEWSLTPEKDKVVCRIWNVMADWVCGKSSWKEPARAVVIAWHEWNDLIGGVR